MPLTKILPETMLKDSTVRGILIEEFASENAVCFDTVKPWKPLLQGGSELKTVSNFAAHEP
ncbi:MAG: hypothetical protein GXO32_05700 [Crenarchaeota archaeon]|nr:hypothetical protein [Thermoproteota archaeon]